MTVEHAPYQQPRIFIDGQEIAYTATQLHAAGDRPHQTLTITLDLRHGRSLVYTCYSEHIRVVTCPNSPDEIYLSGGNRCFVFTAPPSPRDYARYW